MVEETGDMDLFSKVQDEVNKPAKLLRKREDKILTE